MARIRTIKPEFFRHEELQDLENANPGVHTMLVFAGLWGHCDKCGRFEWRPRSIKLDVLPFLNFDMETTLLVLWRAGFIRRYKVDGKEYGEIASFEKHQRINGKEAQEPEKHPSPTEYITGSDGEAIEKHLPAQEGKRKGREEEREEEGKGMDINVALRARREQVAAVFDFWRITLEHPKAAMDDKRRKLIEARLKDGYSPEALCKAISGCSKSTWHMGANDRGARYDGLDLILRDGAKVDQFMAMDDAPPKPQGRQAHIEAINQSVVDEFVNGQGGGQTFEMERGHD